MVEKVISQSTVFPNHYYFNVAALREDAEEYPEPEFEFLPVQRLRNLRDELNKMNLGQ